VINNPYIVTVVGKWPARRWIF